MSDYRVSCIQTIVLLYDDSGEAVGFFMLAEETNPHDPSVTFVTQETYTYVKNLQGDVIRILDSDGIAVVKYTYDPWGVPTVYGDAELAAINPCSDRGYYYDEYPSEYELSNANLLCPEIPITLLILRPMMTISRGGI